MLFSRLHEIFDLFDWYKWAFVFLGLHLLMFTGIIIYRVFFHPLAKYPGPLLAKLTDGYGAYHAYRGVLHLNMWECHQRYGDIVRYGPNRLLINSNTGLHDIYQHSRNVKKSKAYLSIVYATGGWSVLTSIDKSMHRHKRRLMSHCFSDDALRAFEPTMLSQIQTFCDRLSTGVNIDEWTAPKDMREICHWLAFDIMGNFGFGRNFGTLTETKNRFIIDVIRSMNMRTGIYAQFPGLTRLCLESVQHPVQREIRQRALAWVEDLRRTFVSDQEKRGVFSTVFAPNGPGMEEQFSLAELTAELQFLITAGTETSATLLASLLFYLTHFPQAYVTLASEIRTEFSDLDEIRSGLKLASCAYLHACINEAMRMSPPGAGCMWREAGEGGLVIDGEYVPAGYDIGTCIYAIHHNEKYFRDSFRYDPQRWLLPFENSERIEADQKAFNPFSIGPRACVGRSLAMMEISIALARLIWSMDFRMSNGDRGRLGEGTYGARNGRHRVEEYQLMSHLTSWSQGPVIEFRKRVVLPKNDQV